VQYMPPQRFCGCDELNRCYNDRLTRDHNLLVNCRQHCGTRVFLDETLQKVVHCYDEYEHKRADIESQRRQCVENMGSRQCVSESLTTPPQTVTINTTEFLQAGAKRVTIRKASMPSALNQMHACVRTCVKNLGFVQFNADGTPIEKPTLKSAKTNTVNEEKQVPEKNGNDHIVCAAQLNCQLSPVDKKLDKQAKQLCKFQPGHNEDLELQLCTCLETALGQNMYCDQQLHPASCSPSAQSCPESRKSGTQN